MRSVAFLLALASSAFAFTVSEPNNSTGWTTSGPNEVAWTTVSTDPANFTIVLNNQVRTSLRHARPTRPLILCNSRTSSHRPLRSLLPLLTPALAKSL